jgi:hypothetical protein
MDTWDAELRSKEQFEWMNDQSDSFQASNSLSLEETKSSWKDVQFLVRPGGPSGHP